MVKGYIAQQHHSPGPSKGAWLQQKLLRAGDDERWAESILNRGERALLHEFCGVPLTIRSGHFRRASIVSAVSPANGENFLQKLEIPPPPASLGLCRRPFSGPALVSVIIAPTARPSPSPPPARTCAALDSVSYNGYRPQDAATVYWPTRPLEA